MKLKLSLEAAEKLIKYDYSSLSAPHTIINLLVKGKSVVLLENFPAEEEALNSYIATMGQAMVENRNNGGGKIFDVKVVGDENRFNSFANSNYAFPLHTDCSDVEQAPNCVALLCVKQSDVGGISSFCFVSDIIEQMNGHLRDLLLAKAFTFRNSSQPILSKQGNQYFIRYNRITIESFSELNDEEISVLDQFDRIINECAYTLRLKPNDLILFRNDLTLHGRSEFKVDSDRLLKRIRFNLK